MDLVIYYIYKKHLLIFCIMKNSEWIKTIEWLESFKRENANDITSDLYKNFMNSDEELYKFCDVFSDFYYLSCTAFDNDLKRRKKYPEIYAILQRSKHMADWHPLQVLIWKYSEESMAKARKFTEERRKKYENPEFKIWDPFPYLLIIWYYWWTAGRDNEYVIDKIRKAFPDKVKVIIPE